MNRNEEFFELLTDLEKNAPDLSASVRKAKDRRSRSVFLYRPLAGVAACLALFVLLVNVSAPVAKACANVPILKQLVEVATFSRSLSDAVENDYVQPSDMIQEKDGVTAKIEYFIVDEKQVNIFYRLESEEYKAMYVQAGLLDKDGVQEACLVRTPINDVPNEELRLITIDYYDNTVPDSVQLEILAYQLQDDYQENAQPLAEFVFQLEFNAENMAKAIVYPVNETVVLDGQRITVTDIAVYPTHLRVNTVGAADNTAWLEGLDFFIETEKGRFETGAGGILSTGKKEGHTSFRADSTYFYEAEHLKLVITGAKWLRKDIEPTYLNLVTKEHSELPEGAELYYVQKQGDNWTVQFHVTPGEDGEMPRLFGDVIYDSAGNSYAINKHNFIISRINKDGSIQYYHEFVTLENYPDDEVWLAPPYSSIWAAEEPIEITVR